MMHSMTQSGSWTAIRRGILLPIISRKFLILLACLVLCSAVCEVVIKHENRQTFVRLQQLIQTQLILVRHRDHLLLDRGRLLAQHRLSQVARDRLGMVLPRSNAVIRVR
jgi:cell division protein FtsL